jgi:hypothetical protein
MTVTRRPRYPLVSSILVLLALALSAFAATTLAAPANTRPAVRVTGTPQMLSEGVARTMSDIMREAATEEIPEIGEADELYEHEMPSRAGLPHDPAAPPLASVPFLPVDRMVHRPAADGGIRLPFTPQTVSLAFTGATLSGTNPTSSFPPDNDGAVGPTQYIVAVNNRIVSFNKTTGVADGVINATTNTFFSSVRNASGTSDPMIRYDRLSNRWFVTIINVATNQNRWLLAVSDAASNGVISASTVWTYYFFVPATVTPVPTNSTTMFADYPTLGIDANALYVGLDEFAGSGQPFQQCDAFVIRKSSVLSGGPIVVTAFRALMSSPAVGGDYSGPFAPRGVDNPEAGSTEGYLIGSDGNSWGNFWLVRIATPGGTPTMTKQMIPLLAENVSRPVVHPGNTGGYWGYLDNLDDRYFQASIRGQQLWTVHNIDVDNTGVSTGVYATDTRSAARWYQLDVPLGSGTPTIVQAGTVFTASAGNDSLQKQYWMPSLNVTGQGHVAMGFSTAGASNYVNAEVVGRLAGDPLGTMQTPTAISNNTANTYNPASDPGGSSAGRPRRWGDYSQTTVDPLDDQTVWTVQQFVDANNSYGVRVARLLAPPPATPSALADVQVGLPAVTVTLTGTSTTGSAFFDPGADLAAPARPFNHLSAAITTGGASGTPPTVVSATYVNATTVSLVLNTTAATANLAGQKYTITITNPDGQTAAAAVVHVVNTTITATAGAGGSITPSGAVSVPSGADQSFTIAADACYSIADVLVDGVSVGAVPSYTFHGVTANHTIAASFAAGIATAPTALTATQVKSGNAASTTTGVALTYTAPPGASSVEVWRKGFGSYPLYATAPGTGAAPTPPAAYPPAGWTLASGVTASGQVDQPGARDVYYYVAYGRDTCGDASPVSAMTAGVLAYHLGDFTDGVTPGAGDNTVNTADASLLGAHYGASGGGLAGYQYLDVGPTTDYSTDGRPLPDGVVDFEDLVMVALNYAPHVSGPLARAVPVPHAASSELLTLAAPASVKVGEEFEVPVTLSAAGALQALSVGLGWDAAVAAPLGLTAGRLVSDQGGVLLSPGPGRADAALLSVGPQGLVGEGALVTVRFRALRDGDPQVTLARAVGRDAANHDVPVALYTPPAVTDRVPTTELAPVIPNPTAGSALVQFGLAQRGPVRLAVYDVDGRLVRTLAQGEFAPGRYQFTWDGADARGDRIHAGMFFVRLEAARVRKTRVVSVIR